MLAKCLGAQNLVKWPQNQIQTAENHFLSVFSVTLVYLSGIQLDFGLLKDSYCDIKIAETKIAKTNL